MWKRYFLFWGILPFFETGSYPNWPQTWYLTQTGPELMILVLQPPKHEDERHVNHAWLGTLLYPYARYHKRQPSLSSGKSMRGVFRRSRLSANSSASCNLSQESIRFQEVSVVFIISPKVKTSQWRHLSFWSKIRRKELHTFLGKKYLSWPDSRPSSRDLNFLGLLTNSHMEYPMTSNIL
jgi:hypothetical protein